MLLEAIMPVGNWERDKHNIFQIINELPPKIHLQIVLDKREQEHFQLLVQSVPPKKRGAVSIHQGKDYGPGLNRNLGILHSSAKYLMFWDSDDFPKCDAIEAVLPVLSDEKFDVVIGEYQEKYKIGEKEISKQIIRGTSAADWIGFPGIWRHIFSRRIIGQTTFSDLMWAEDLLFLSEIFAKNPRYLTLNRCLYVYYRSTNSLTSQINETNIGHLIKATQLIGKIVKNQQKPSPTKVMDLYMGIWLSVVAKKQVAIKDKMKLTNTFLVLILTRNRLGNLMSIPYKLFQITKARLT